MFNQHTNYNNGISKDVNLSMGVESSIDMPLDQFEDTLINDDFHMLDPFIDSFYKYMDYLIDSNKVKKYHDKIKVKYFPRKNKLFDEGDTILSFVIGFRNRPKRALLSIESLIRSAAGINIEIILVEDSSNNLISLDELSFRKEVTYYRINTGSKEWSRAKVFNYGTKRATGKYIVIWDICFLCNHTFVRNLVEYVKIVNFRKNVISVAVYESHSIRSNPIGKGYGNLWVYDSSCFKSIRGFSEDRYMEGYEHSDVKNRMKIGSTLHSMYVNPKLYVIHMSHDIDQNQLLSRLGRWKNNLTIIPNQDNWGDSTLLYIQEGIPKPVPVLPKPVTKTVPVSVTVSVPKTVTVPVSVTVSVPKTVAVPKPVTEVSIDEINIAISPNIQEEVSVHEESPTDETIDEIPDEIFNTQDSDYIYREETTSTEEATNTLDNGEPPSTEVSSLDIPPEEIEFSESSSTEESEEVLDRFEEVRQLIEESDTTKEYLVDSQKDGHMKVAIYEGERKHTELIGCFIEIFNELNIKHVDIFYIKDDFRNAFSYYKRILNTQHITEYPHDKLFLMHDRYDIIIALSADEITHFRSRPDYSEIKDKLAVICHTILHFEQPLPGRKIVLTPLLFDKCDDYILPIYKSDDHVPEFRPSCKGSKIDSLVYKITEKKLPILTIVGFKTSHYNLNTKDYGDLLKLLAYMSHGYTLCIFGSSIPALQRSLGKYTNVHYAVNATTNVMMDVVKVSTFILPLPTPDKWFYVERLSGSYSIAISNNIPMIIPEKIREIYGFRGCITYEDSLVEVINRVISISPEEYTSLIFDSIDFKKEVFEKNIRSFCNIFSFDIDEDMSDLEENLALVQRSSLKVAIYQRGSHHTELIGSFIELIKQLDSNSQIDIYYNKKDSLSWIEYFIALYSDLSNINTYLPNELSIRVSGYDLVIMLTGDERNVFRTSPDNIISVIHAPYQIDPKSPEVPMVLTPVLSHLSPHYILPIYQKQNETWVPTVTRFAVVGMAKYCLKHKDSVDLEKLLKTYTEGYEVYLFTRKNGAIDGFRKYEHIKIFENTSTLFMLEKLKECKFILPLPLPYSWYYKDRLSGAIPLAINNNIPMIMPARLNNIYQVDGCITYERSVCEVMDRVLGMSDYEYMELVDSMVAYKKKRSEENLITFKKVMLVIKERAISKIREQLHQFPNTKKGNFNKLMSLKDKLKGKTAYLITCGPSFKYCLKYLDQIFSDPNAVVLSVKQAFNYIKEEGYSCHLHTVNFCNENEYDYGDHPPISMYTQKRQVPLGSKNINDYDIVVSHMDNSETANIHSGIIDGVDRMSISSVFTPENNLHYWGDIIHELCLPLLIQLGCKTIYAIGWDCGNLSEYFDTRDTSKLHARPKIREILDLQLIESSRNLHTFMKEKFDVDIYNVGEYSALKIPTVSYAQLFDQQTL